MAIEGGWNRGRGDLNDKSVTSSFKSNAPYECQLPSVRATVEAGRCGGKRADAAAFRYFGGFSPRIGRSSHSVVKRTEGGTRWLLGNGSYLP